MRYEGQKRWVAAWLCCMLLFAYAPAHSATLTSAPLVSGSSRNGMVRVHLSSMGNPSTLNITVSGSYTVNGVTTQTLGSGSTVTVNFNSSTGRLSLTANGTTTDMGSAFKLRRHATLGSNGLKIAQARVPSNLYPGDLSFVVQGSKLYVIAYVYIEDYLYGVLPYEMGNSSPLEALKAQAVCARTYTLRAMNGSSSRLYDVVDTTTDQVYSGTPSGNANCVAAVNATKGIVSMNGSDLTGTYYTASNGGQIESIKNIWGSTSYSYIRVKDDPYDYDNPDSRVKSFTVNASGSQSSTLQSLLNNKATSAFGSGATVTGVTGVVPHTPKYASPSRLYTKMDFTVTYTRNGTSGSGTLTFDIFNELESPLGMSIQTSDNELWTVRKTSSGFVVEARRYGHGTGLSQRGAMYMGELGYSYDQIMAFYFEGCKRVQYTFTSSILSAVVDGGTSSEIITPEEPAPLEEQTGCTGIVTLISSTATLPLRQSASSSGTVLATLTHGATVNVYGASGDYYLIGYGLLYGYVLKSSVSISGAVPSTTSVTPTQLAGYGTVNTDGLNLRETASTSGKIVTTIPQGTVLPLLSISNGWARTQYGRQTGYVMMDYIRSTSGYDTPVTDPTAVSADIKTATTLRISASTSAYAMASLAVGTEVAVLSSDASWSKIRYQKMTGYVPTAAITLTGHTTPQLADDAPGSGESYAYVASNTSLNLRASASTEAALIVEMPYGAQVIVESKGTTWCTLRYQGIRGYAMTQYLTFASDTPSGESGTWQARVTTVSGSLNLRKTATSNGTVLTTIPQNTVITITEKGTTWCKTTYNGREGYVMTCFLTFIEEAIPTATPTPTPAGEPTPTPALPSSLQARVTTVSGSLNLRASGQSGAKVLTTIPQNTVITVYEKGITWCMVTYAGEVGYVMTSFLTFLTDTPTPTSAPADEPTATPNPVTPTTYQARVTTVSGSLNLRISPQSNAKVLATIPQNMVITVLEKGMTWCQTTYNGYSGYVMTSFLTFLNGEATPTASPTPTPTPTVTVSPTPTASMIPSTGVQAQVITPSGSLNLRAAANDNAKVLATIPQYGIVDVLLQGMTWCQVAYDGETGFVMTSYLSFLSDTKTPQPSATPTQAPVQTSTPAPGGTTYTARVTTVSGSLNLRKTANDSAKVLITIPQNTLITVYEKGITWCYATYGSYTGYVMTKFLTFSTDGETPPAVVTPTPAPDTPTAPPASSGDSKYDERRDSTLRTLDKPVIGKVLSTDGSPLTLRKGCSTNATSLVKMPEDDYLLVIQLGEEWCYVQYEDKTGYCLTEYLQIYVP